MESKNILFIARWYPDRNDPMPGLFILRHAQAVRRIYNVTVLYVTTDVKLKPFRFETEKSNTDGIEEIKIYFGKHPSEFINAFMYAFHYIRAVYKIKRPDMVHVHVLSRTAFPALWLKFTSGIPFIITEHWSRYLPENVKKGAFKGLLRKIFTKYAVAKASAVTTVTRNLAEAMQHLGLHNTYYITPNVADTELFKPAENISNNNGQVKLIHVSCFDEPAKNIKGIVDVLADLAVLKSNFTMTFIGDGPDFEAVKDYAASTGLTGSVLFFTGLLEGMKLVNYMRKADAMVMFSNYENLPCTIVESLCCGVPVVSSDVGGIAEHVTFQNGILVKPADKKALKEAILAIIDRKALFNKDAISQYGKNVFSMDAVGFNFKSIYQKYFRNP